MRHGVRVLASPALAAGFRLAGVPADDVADAADAGAVLASAAALPNLGILIVEEAILDALSPAVRRDVERRAIPIVVPLPAPSWSGGARDAEEFILELLRRAIGYRVRLQ